MRGMNNTNTTPTILLVDDDRRVLEMLDDTFCDDYKTLLAQSGVESVEQIRGNAEIAAVVMDIKMGGMDGIEAARRIREISPDVPVIFHTGYPGDYDEDVLNETEKPFDYVLKGDALPRLKRAVRNAVETFALRNSCKELVRHAESFYRMIGNSAAMQEVYHKIRKVAATDGKIMIIGETGTGKELVARAIHNSSSRKDKRLGIFSCNHKSTQLVEAELFGHVKGAFTGAVHDRVGLFEYANGGTVFLDEIGDLDPRTQTKVLRVLENGEYQPIGTSELRATDVRIICATHKNLQEMVEEETFRQDLYYRLRGVKIVLPPLRERREDIPLLIEKFKDHYTIEQGLSPKIFEQKAIDILLQHDWPGNVRQLMDTIESLIVMAESDLVMADDVVAYLELESMPETADGGNLSQKVRQYERSLIVDALQQCNVNIAAAARMLKIDRANLRKKIRYHKIDLSIYRQPA
jgi:DNA-binding NtrC family response regulator